MGGTLRTGGGRRHPGGALVNVRAINGATDIAKPLWAESRLAAMIADAAAEAEIVRTQGGKRRNILQCQ